MANNYTQAATRVVRSLPDDADVDSDKIEEKLTELVETYNLSLENAIDITTKIHVIQYNFDEQKQDDIQSTIDLNSESKQIEDGTTTEQSTGSQDEEITVTSSQNTTVSLNAFKTIVRARVADGQCRLHNTITGSVVIVVDIDSEGIYYKPLSQFEESDPVYEYWNYAEMRYSLPTN